jgi:hypothetical protein
MKISSFFVYGFCITILSITGFVTAAPSTIEGEASYQVPFAGMTANRNNDDLSCAVPVEVYDQYVGKCLKVKGPLGTITVKVPS